MLPLKSFLSGVKINHCVFSLDTKPSGVTHLSHKQLPLCACTSVMLQPWKEVKNVEEIKYFPAQPALWVDSL